jgi:ubiquinone/menaquinone biosynthesis C-methylase UbiE
MEKIKQKFKELLKLSDENKDEVYDFAKILIAYKLKVHLEEIFRMDVDPLPLFEKEIDNATNFFRSLIDFNLTYKDDNLRRTNFASSDILEVEKKVHSLYGSLWTDFDDNKFFKESYELFKTRLERNNVNISWFKNKICLDAGCGGGRYACAIAQLGAAKVLGIDIGTQGIEDANKRICGTEFENTVEFKEASVLDMPFENQSFDFVMSNGVLHHTTNPITGINEIYRVLKPAGKMWLYLYGEGGLEECAFEYIRKLLKNVPRELTQTVMILLGLPANRRFYMLDHFYVAIRKTYSETDVRKMLKDAGFKNVSRLYRGTDFDTVEQVTKNKPFAQIKYGVGDLRFMAEK